MPAAKPVKLPQPISFDEMMKRTVKVPPPPSSKKAKQRKVWRKKRR